MHFGLVSALVDAAGVGASIEKRKLALLRRRAQKDREESRRASTEPAAAHASNHSRAFDRGDNL
jgi:hypothetical protein